jgi:hypothetical protein
MIILGLYAHQISYRGHWEYTRGGGQARVEVGALSFSVQLGRGQN